MRLYNFKRAHSSLNLRSIFIEHGVDENTADEILDRIDHQLYFYDDCRDSPNLNIMWRLSIIPFFLVTFIAITIVCPIKWIFTGKYKLGYKKPKWLWNWSSKFY